MSFSHNCAPSEDSKDADITDRQSHDIASKLPLDIIVGTGQYDIDPSIAYTARDDVECTSECQENYKLFPTDGLSHDACDDAANACAYGPANAAASHGKKKQGKRKGKGNMINVQF